MHKLDTYESVIKDPKGKAEIDATRRLYQSDRRRNYELREKKNALFLDGRRAGLHYGKTVESLQPNRELEDKKTRRGIAKKGRAIYQRHYTLSKNFRSKARTRVKGKSKSK